MELWELVRLVSARYGKRLQQHLAAPGAASRAGEVTVQQFQYLQAIHRLPSPTIGALSAQLGVRSPTVTVAVQRLMERGLVSKHPHPTDARSSRLALTARARRLFVAQERAFRALGEDIRGALSASELQQYTRLTAQVCEALERLDGAAEGEA